MADDNSIQVIYGTTRKGKAVAVPAGIFTERINKFLRDASFQDKQKRLQKINRTSQRAIRLARKAGKFANPECRPELDVYLDSKDSVAGLAGTRASRRSAQWLCNARINYDEKNYSVQNNDIRVFIEGAEVTPYIRGAVQWNIETTGGMNQASFTLNNNHDAFILTPQNCCANLRKTAWRIHGGRVPQRGRFFSAHPGRDNARIDESAKYTIYQLKYRAVKPGSPDEKIDKVTGTWLFPLNPFSSIINKHDAVRIFVRLPQISGARRKLTKEYNDLWIPAFTGFVSGYSWTDNAVTADRFMAVQCYDYRGLMERMRVRVLGNPTRAKGLIDKQRQPPEGPYSYSDPALTRARPGVLPFEATNDNRRTRGKLGRLGLIDFIDRYNHKLTEVNVILNCKSTEIGVNTPCARQQLEKTRKAVTVEVKEIFAILDRIDLRARELRARDGKFREIVLTSKKVNGAPQVKFKALKNAEARQVGSDVILNEAIAFLKGDARKATDLLSEVDSGVSGALLEWDRLGIVRLPRKEQQTATGPELVVDTSFVPTNTRKILGEWNAKKLAAILGQLPLRFRQKLGALFIDGNPNLGLKPINDLSPPEKTVTILNNVRGQIGSSNTKNAELQAQLDVLNNKLARLGQELQEFETRVANFFRNNRSQAVQRRRVHARRVIDEWVRARAEGSKQTIARVPNAAGNLADIYLNHPTFEKATAGLFADLIRAVEKAPHPLAGMSFEQAIEWLCTEGTNVVRGAWQDLLSYTSKGDLEKWNRVCLFGQVGRPLTFHEVTFIGIRTITSDHTSPFNPVNVFLNLLLPKKGTGARTIVQEQIGPDIAGEKSHQYETRKSLVDQICTLLDYQFFVSPMGDLVFELPHYNVLPLDFGNTFKGAYRLERELITSTISEESTDLNTAWIITGHETDKRKQDITDGSVVAKNKLATITIMAPILAKRHGVRVTHLNLNLPGVGAMLTSGKDGGVTRDRAAAAQYQLFMYGLFQIQREWGMAHKISVTHPFRPYLLPNRPMHVVHRQRMGLIQSVQYSMAPPDGECSSSCNIGYVRYLGRDGRFNHLGGGPRMPIDYTQFTSAASIKVNVRDKAGSFSKNPRFVEDVRYQNFDTVPRDLSSSTSSARTQGLNKSASKTGDALQNAFSQKSRSLSTSTAGGQSAASSPSTASTTSDGKRLKVKVGSQSGIGRRVSRKKVKTGNPAARVVDLKRSGIVASTEDKAKSNKNDPTKNAENDNSYQISKFLHDPLPFLAYKKSVEHVESWGYLRTPSYGATKNELSAFHGGVDLFSKAGRGGIGAAVYAPIYLDFLEANMDIGPRIREGNIKSIPWKETLARQEVAPGEAPLITILNEKTLHPPHAEKFAVRGTDGKPKLKAVSVEKFGNDVKTVWNAKIYQTEFEAWKKSGRFNSFASVGLGGLRLRAHGWLDFPKGSPVASTGPNANKNPGRLRCYLSYAHLGRLGTTSGLRDQKGRLQKGFYGVHVKYAEADPERKTPIGYVGMTGNTRSPHLHLTMAIFLKQWTRKKGRVVVVNLLEDAAYKSAVQEVLKSNKSFLIRSLALKLTATGGQFKEDPLNSTLSKRWKRNLRGKVRTKDGKTVDVNTAKAIDVINALREFGHSDFRKKFNSRTNFKSIVGHQLFYVNPLFFFKPEQVIEYPRRRRTDAPFRFQKTGRRAAAPGAGDSTDFICKGRGRTGLEQVKRKFVLDRAENNRKTAGASAAQGPSIRKRQDRNRSLAKKRNTSVQQIESRLSRTQPERVEATLHAAVDRHLEYERQGGALAPDTVSLANSGNDFSTINNLS